MSDIGEMNPRIRIPRYSEILLAPCFISIAISVCRFRLLKPATFWAEATTAGSFLTGTGSSVPRTGHPPRERVIPFRCVPWSVKMP